MTLTVLPRQKAEKPCSEPTRVKQSTMPASRGGRGERWMERQRGGAEAAVLHAGCRGDALKVKPAGLAGGCSSPGAAAQRSRRQALGGGRGRARARVALDLARDDLRVGVLRLDQKLHALDRRGGGLGDRAGHAAREEVLQEGNNTPALSRGRRGEGAAGGAELALLQVDRVVRAATRRHGMSVGRGPARADSPHQFFCVPGNARHARGVVGAAGPQHRIAVCRSDGTWSSSGEGRGVAKAPPRHSSQLSTVINAVAEPGADPLAKALCCACGLVMGSLCLMRLEIR